MSRWSLKPAAALAALAIAGAAAAQDHPPITFHTGSVGGLYMEPAVIWADQWAQSMPDVEVAVVLGGAVTNPLTVSAEQPGTALGWTSLPGAVDAMRGREDYATRAPEGLHDLRALWRANVLTWLNVLARPGAVPEGVDTVGELLAEEPALDWAMSARGTTREVATRRLLEAYGVSYEDLEAWGGTVSFNSVTDSAKMLIDGHADVYISADSAPNAAVLDMDASIPGLVWLGVEDDVLASLEKEYGYIVDAIPTEHYASLDHPVRTIAYDHLVFTHKDMDQELVYEMTLDILKSPQRTVALPAMATFDPSVAWKSTGFDLHPGAQRAYRELGLMD